MRHLDLFSGIGGFSLAASWAGYETVQFVENDPFCQRVLRKHWPEVPVHDDIRTFDGRPFRSTVDLLTGGFPCQPYSVAGKRRGAADDRALWPEMRRVIDEARPRWVLAENVPGFISLGLDGVLADLEGLDYETGAAVLPACAVNAPHRRDRVWIVAYAEDAGLRRGIASGQAGQRARDVEAVDDAGSGRHGTSQEQVQARWNAPFDPVAYARPAATRGADDGIPGRLDRHRGDRLRSLGNAIVPSVAYEIIRHLTACEEHA